MRNDGLDTNELAGGRYASLQNTQPNRNVNYSGMGGTINPSKQLLLQPVLNYSQVLNGVQQFNNQHQDVLRQKPAEQYGEIIGSDFKQGQLLSKSSTLSI